jgi:hypothetical protein
VHSPANPRHLGRCISATSLLPLVLRHRTVNGWQGPEGRRCGPHDSASWLRTQVCPTHPTILNLQVQAVVPERHVHRAEDLSPTNSNTRNVLKPGIGSNRKLHHRHARHCRMPWRGAADSRTEPASGTPSKRATITSPTWTRFSGLGGDRTSNRAAPERRVASGAEKGPPAVRNVGERGGHQVQ